MIIAALSQSVCGKRVSHFNLEDLRDCRKFAQVPLASIELHKASMSCILRTLDAMSYETVCLWPTKRVHCKPSQAKWSVQLNSFFRKIKHWFYKFTSILATVFAALRFFNFSRLIWCSYCVVCSTSESTCATGNLRFTSSIVLLYKRTVW